MAYDLKQSTSDAPLVGGAERFRNPGVGASIPVNLTQVFRSTPQIASFLSDLDASFPAIGLDGVFDTYAGHSNEDDGDVPDLLEFDTDTELIDGVLDRARRTARGLPDEGRQVAVLCLNEERFDRYRQAGRNDGKFVPVTSREDLRELQYAKTRCVFSMPEYVAWSSVRYSFLDSC